MPKTFSPPAAPSVPNFAVVLTEPTLKTINKCLGINVPMPDYEGEVPGYDRFCVVEHDESLLLVIEDLRGEIRPVLTKAGITILPTPA